MPLFAALLDIYSLVVLVAVVSSWIQVDPRNPIIAAVRSVTEPVLGPIRQFMPDMGGIDFSPMVLLLLLRVLRGIF
jgi:YggT family protein